MSNFHPCKVRFEDVNYASVEHAYQTIKATCLGEDDLAGQIKNAETAAKAKTLSNKLGESEEWNAVKKTVMTELIKSKISSCPEFKMQLINSGTMYLAESTNDLFWASGLNRKLTSVTWPANFPGQNTLGNILMDERKKLLIMSESEKHDLRLSAIENKSKETTGIECEKQQQVLSTWVSTCGDRKVKKNGEECNRRRRR
jgi:ribA/ribD-fused uncharacterized protein